MAEVLDVAAYILKKQGPMTAMKLQKLVYYCQAWSLVWQSKPLFPNDIEAWANGPVSRELYRAHRGQFRLASISGGRSIALKAAERRVVNPVLGYYGDKTPQWLSELTHAEAPWKDAREGLAPGARGQRKITQAAMAEYYGSL